MPVPRKFYGVLFPAGAALLLCWVAFFNGFPLVYSDTGTYLESGLTLETPLDRPITYGLLIRFFSLNGISLWPVIIIQSFLLTFLIWKTIQEFFGEGKSARILFSVGILVLSFLSALPVVAGELIADIFTAICLLSFFLLVFGRDTKHARVYLFIIFTLSVACHISHVLIIIALVVLILIARWLQKRKDTPVYSALKPMLITTLLAVVALMSMMSSISKSRHVFMMGHLVETGILNAYLDDNCGKKNISLCAYRDRIPPGAETFIWNSDGDSVLLKTGGWLGSKEEYSRIISETFGEWKYLKMHIASAFTGTVRQLYTIRAGEGLGVYDSSMLVSQRIKKYFPGEYPSYLNSRQSADEFAALPVIDAINKITTAIAVLVILAWCIYRRKSSSHALYWRFTGIILAAYLLNCAICATFATVANRFGARLSWMFILLAVILMCEWVLHSRKAKSSVN